MRFALIDNSTLTGVQRLLGRISVRNTLCVDMDILCLENLIEAILFYDRVAVVDDYKRKYRDQRRTTFPNLLNLTPTNIAYDQIISRAKEITEGIIPRVEAGQFTDGDFRPFFDLLKMNVTFTWDMRSSIYFLTQKMLEGVGGLDLEKYSKLSSAIFFELYDKRRTEQTNGANEDFVLIDRNKRMIEDSDEFKIVDIHGIKQDAGGLAHQTRMFFAGLNWLAFRTIFYTIAANSLGIDLFIHPIRHGFQANLLSKLSRQDIAFFKPLIDAINDSANQTLNKVLAPTQPFVMKQKIPLFVTWFAHKVGDPRNYIETAYELREEVPFRKARKRLIELEMALSENNSKAISEANKILREVEKTLSKIETKYYVTTDQGVSTSNLITLWNVSTLATKLPSVPNLSIRIPQLEPLKHLLPQNGFKAIYRTLVSDLVGVSRLGKYYDIIASRIRLDEHSDTYYEKTEDVRFKDFQAYWKIPM
jgi:hypothetical protein